MLIKKHDKMTKKHDIIEDGVTWLDVYDFIRLGWRTIVGFALFGLVIGLAIAFYLPEKFRASAVIESAQLAHIHKVGSRVDGSFSVGPLEMGPELVQKMRDPAFYSNATIKKCGLEGLANPSAVLANRLSLSSTANSKNISILYLAPSSATAKGCLEGVMQDVISNQKPRLEGHIKHLQHHIADLERDLQSAISLKKQRLSKIEEKIADSKAKLLVAENFVEKFFKDEIQIQSKNTQLVNTALLLRDKRNQINHLETRIDELENNMTIHARADDELIKSLTEVLIQLRPTLAPWNTKPAFFVSSITASDQRVQPKRGLIAMGGLLLGGALGIALLLVPRIFTRLREGLNARKS